MFGMLPWAWAQSQSSLSKRQLEGLGPYLFRKKSMVYTPVPALGQNRFREVKGADSGHLGPLPTQTVGHRSQCQAALYCSDHIFLWLRIDLLVSQNLETNREGPHWRESLQYLYIRKETRNRTGHILAALDMKQFIML
jgi:hypothetical protein